MYWKIKREKVRVGAEAGSLNNYGYLRVGIEGRRYLVHRLIWLIENGGVDSSLQIDHINGDRADNRISNLRLVSHRENGQNRKDKRENTKSSRFVGVSFDKHAGKWKSCIKINGKNKHLGLFTSEEEAHQAYQTALNLLGEIK